MLVEDVLALDEVVVVGYGTQKRVNLTGSISVIDSEELSQISTPALTQSLMGLTSGVFIKNQSGQPGASDVLFNIRGFGDPLIIVDGMEVSDRYFNQLDPYEIESLNVLKDAAAASVYGARAGNGVILVTTKRGQTGSPKFAYNGVFGAQFFTKKPDFVSSHQYAQMENIARTNQGLDPIWTNEQIQLFQDGTDPAYPNNDMWDLTLREFAPQSQHNINVRGGTDRVKYFVSAGWFHQDGMLRSDDIKHDRYSLRSNIDVELTQKLNMRIDLSVTNQDYIGPRANLQNMSARERGDWNGIMMRIFRHRPFYPINEHPDPSYLAAYGSGATVNPIQMSYIENVGYIKWTRLFGDAKLDFTYDLPFGLQARAVYNFKRMYYRYKRKTKEAPGYDYDPETDTYIYRRSIFPYSEVGEYMDILNNLNQQYYLTWNKEVKNHNLDALFVHERLADNYNYFTASRIRYEFDLDYLFAGPDLDKSNNGFATEGGRIAYIGRLNYNYNNKYLLELNSRWDASPNFPPETRWGFFPSVSVGWRISEEDFIKNNFTFLDNLKLRASHGILGYDRAGNFQYLATYSFSGNYIYGDDVVSKGLAPNALPNTEITWEKMTTSNAGLDFSLWNNKIAGSFDYFYRLRSDVLGTRISSIPNIVGANMPRVNYMELDNRGWEVSLEHRNNIGQINYSLGGNVSWNREKYLNIDQNEFATMEEFRRGNRIGEWTDRYWLYPTDGLFQSAEEIENWADIDGKNNATIEPGDVKYIDSNGDGRITGDDMIIAGRGKYPRFTYGINMSTSYKGLEFSMLWQGAGLYNYTLGDSWDYFLPFYANNAPTTDMYFDSYTPENPWIESNTTNATRPRYRTDSYNRSHASYRRNTDFWLINNAYIRLKNVRLAYNLPTNMIEKWGLGNCVVYLSGHNVLTFSALSYLDPEANPAPEEDWNSAGWIGSLGTYYPILGTYNLGIQINF